MAICSVIVALAACPDGSDSAPDSGSGAVAECQASVDAVRAACAAAEPTSDRLCLYDAMRPLCASGRTDFVKAIFDCLQMDACQSPSDPSGATACVRAAIHQHATSNDHALGAATCACSTEPNCSADEPAHTLANTMMLLDTDVPGVTACATAAGCPVPDSCLSSTALGPAFTCP